MMSVAPLSLLFGTNSSGKSSIGQFLMMLKQTVDSSDRGAVFYPGEKNSVVQLGSFRDMVFRHDLKKSIAFEYSWELPEIARFPRPAKQDVCSGNMLSFTAEVESNGSEHGSPRLKSLRYQLLDAGKSVMELGLGLDRKSTSGTNYVLQPTDHGLMRQQGRPGKLRSAVHFYGFPSEVVTYHQNADFTQRLNLYHEKLFRSIYYLGPLRTRAERMYHWSGIETESVGYMGEHAIAALLTARAGNRRISLGYGRRTKSFEQIVALKLKQMGLIEELKVTSIDDQQQIYKVEVRTRGLRDWVALPDIGIGVSQVLPVLVQCFYAPPGSIIIMEQPEIHLHPKAQAALADVMIDVIHSRENGKDRNIQLIIETHSEHFLRRVQRRIAEEEDLQKKVSAYYADVTRRSTALQCLEVNALGYISNWPRDFFGDEMSDSIEQGKAALKKQQRRAMEPAKTTR